MTDDMVLVDVHGKKHPLTRWNIGWMLGAGWIFFLASQILNFIYYQMHPSSTDCSWNRLLRRFETLWIGIKKLGACLTKGLLGLVFVPVAISLIVIMSLPVLTIGTPVWMGMYTYNKFQMKGTLRRTIATISCVILMVRLHAALRIISLNMSMFRL